MFRPKLKCSSVLPALRVQQYARIMSDDIAELLRSIPVENDPNGLLIYAPAFQASLWARVSALQVRRPRLFPSMPRLQLRRPSLTARLVAPPAGLAAGPA